MSPDMSCKSNEKQWMAEQFCRCYLPITISTPALPAVLFESVLEAAHHSENQFDLGWHEHSPAGVSGVTNHYQALRAAGQDPETDSIWQWRYFTDKLQTLRGDNVNFPAHLGYRYGYDEYRWEY